MACFGIKTDNKLTTEFLNRNTHLTIFYAPDLERLIIYPFKKRVAGIEPATPCPKTPVTMQDSEFSVEALIKILTEISGKDRQILTQIVQRWGSLSDELKRAVLRVVG